MAPACPHTSGGGFCSGEQITIVALADSQRDVDFAQTPIHAIFVIHDKGLDWAAATQVITELLESEGGILGSKRTRLSGQPRNDIPLILTNPDFIWKK